MELPVNYNNISAKKRKQAKSEYIKKQDNKCFYCKHPLNINPPKYITNKKINWQLFPPGFLNNPIHLQHDHNTGMTEGAVHAYCNAVMWQYEGR